MADTPTTPSGNIADDNASALSLQLQLLIQRFLQILLYPLYPLHLLKPLSQTLK